MDDTVVVRAGSGEERALGADWRLAHVSWGARLRLADRFDAAPLAALVAACPADVRELDASAADEVLQHELALRADYPGGPATAPSVGDAASAAALWHGGRVFGALVERRLVAVSAVHVEGDRVETDFTSVARDQRGRGLAVAVKAASVLALAEGGHRRFGTGGAAENTAGIRMNERLGYRVEETWHTWVRV